MSRKHRFGWAITIHLVRFRSLAQSKNEKFWIIFIKNEAWAFKNKIRTTATYLKINFRAILSVLERARRGLTPKFSLIFTQNQWWLVKNGPGAVRLCLLSMIRGINELYLPNRLSQYTPWGVSTKVSFFRRILIFFLSSLSPQKRNFDQGSKTHSAKKSKKSSSENLSDPWQYSAAQVWVWFHVHGHPWIQIKGYKNDNLSRSVIFLITLSRSVEISSEFNATAVK